MHPETRRLAIRLGLSLTAAWAAAVALCFAFYFGMSAVLRHVGPNRPPATIGQLLHRLPAARPAGLPGH